MFEEWNDDEVQGGENIGIQFQETKSSDWQGFISKLKAHTEDFVTILFFFYQQK